MDTGEQNGNKSDLDAEAARELSLVNKVELRIALADSDLKLEKLLSIYLTPLLLKLTSPSLQVRGKILQISSHILSRLGSSPIKLPVLALLKLFKDPQCDLVSSDPYLGTLRATVLMFIKRSLSSLDMEEKNNLFIEMLSGFSHWSSNREYARIFLHLLGDFTSKFSQDDRISQFDKTSIDSRDICNLIKDFLLLDLRIFSVQRDNDQQETNDQGTSNQSQENTTVGVFLCPGLAADRVLYLTNNSKQTFGYQESIRIKQGALRFLSSEGFPNNYVFLPSLIATLDPDLGVSRIGEELFRKLKIDYENDDIVMSLSDLFTGNRDQQRLSAKPPLQAKIIQLLSKSIKAANYHPYDIVVIGLQSEAPKVVQGTIQFVYWVSRMASQASIQELAPKLIHDLRSWIESQGWPTVQIQSSASALSLRGSSYEAIGMLAKRTGGQLAFNDDLALTKFLFDSLKGEDANLRGSVQEALSMLLPTLHNLSSSDTQKLQSLILAQVKSSLNFYEDLLNEPDTGHNDVSAASQNAFVYINIKYANASLPFSSAIGRFICILGLTYSSFNTSSTNEISEESSKGLHPYWFRRLGYHEEDLSGRHLTEPPTFPSLVEILNLVRDPANSWGKSEFQGLTLVGFMAAVRFARDTIVMTSIKGHKTVIEVDADFRTKLDKAIEFDETVGSLVKSNISQSIGKKDDDGLNEYLSCLSLAMTLNSASESEEKLSQYWIEFLSFAPPEFIHSVATQQVDSLEKLRFSSRYTILENINRGLAIISTSFPDYNIEGLEKSCSEFDDTSHPAALISSQHQQAALLQIGFSLSRMQLRDRITEIPVELRSKSFNIISKTLLSTKDPLLLLSSLEAYSQLCIFKAVHLYSQKAPSETDNYFTGDKFNELSQRLFNLAKAGNEKAVLALGYQTLSSDSEINLWQKVVDKIFDLHESKQIDLTFASGEALCCSAAGWESTLLGKKIDIVGTEIPVPKDDGLRLEFLAQVIDQVLEKCKSTKPALRKSSCIWLLTLLQYCAKLAPMQARLKECHLAFMSFLAEKDELVQESASRGLNVVYESGSKALRDDLVRSLVQSFSGETKKVNAGTVSSETQLFEPGTLNTGDGNSISSYKDVLSLASDLGDPGLVYRFMSLASHSALWASRRGAAFGLGAILSKSQVEELFANNPKLSKNLIPKLYRYRFDVSSNVRETMNGIWNTLISDSNETVNQNFKDILTELLTSMGDREWRVREASTVALTELLQGRPLSTYMDHLEQIWKMAFRILDDIKDSVRKSGLALCKALAKTLIHNLGESGSVNSSQFNSLLSTVIPFFMGTEGIQSQAEEVRAFSLDTLLKICKRGSTKTLKPFISDLITELISLMSELEPQAVNYIALNADKYGLTNEAIDANRLSSIKHSPMMEATERLIDLADEDVMAEFVPKLQRTIKKSVGLPSKVAGSRLLVILVIGHLQLVRPHANQLLKSAAGQLSDRSETVASSYATACGYLARVADNQVVLNLVNVLKRWIFENEGEERKGTIAALTIYAISRHASDKFLALSSTLLPICYVASHIETQTEIAKKSFSQAWSENTGGVGAIKLYLNEIIELASGYMSTSQQWGIRQACALSVADACSAAADAPELLDSESKLFDILLVASSGRSWVGKESVLKALVSFSKAHRQRLLKDKELVTKLNQTMLTEARRNNEEYREHSLPLLCEFCGIVPTHDLITACWELVEHQLKQDATDHSEDDITNGDDGEQQRPDTKRARHDSTSTILESRQAEDKKIKLLTSWAKAFRPKDTTGAEISDDYLNRIVSAILWQLKSGKNVSWQMRKAACECLTSICENYVAGNVSDKAASLNSKQAKSLVELWLRISSICLDKQDPQNTELVRLCAVESGGKLALALGDNNDMERKQVKDSVESTRKGEISPQVIARLDSLVNN